MDNQILYTFSQNNSQRFSTFARFGVHIQSLISELNVEVLYLSFSYLKHYNHSILFYISKNYLCFKYFCFCFKCIVFYFKKTMQNFFRFTLIVYVYTFTAIKYLIKVDLTKTFRNVF